MSDKITERIIYTGRVQGVGFRYAVQSIARKHSVTGFVRNLPDGTVELVLQGKVGASNALLAEVAEQFRGNIRHGARSPFVSPEPLEGFEIRY